jgi:hypothetical protein
LSVSLRELDLGGRLRELCGRILKATLQRSGLLGESCREAQSALQDQSMWHLDEAGDGIPERCPIAAIEVGKVQGAGQRGVEFLAGRRRREINHDSFAPLIHQGAPHNLTGAL